jgi:hypothetical protein
MTRAESEHPMIGASKILTVSYGTFSCTLEGFEDPFNTMKAIAEYFRDLAAEDRYFGAEPPTPDAAMLHRIAEREIQRRVEAKIQDNGVILRAAEIAEPTAPVAAPGPAAQPSPAVAPAGLLAEESVAAKLQRIRSAVARSAAAAAAAPVVEAAVIEDAVIEDEPVALSIEAPAESLRDQWEELDAAAEAAAAEEAAEAEADLREALEAEEPAFVADAPEEDEIILEAVVADAVEEVPAEEPVMEEAEEIRAETPEFDEIDIEAVGDVALPDDLADTLPEDLAPETAEDLPEAAEDELDEALVAALSAPSPEPLILTRPEAEAEADADLSEMLARLEDETSADTSVEAEEVVAYAEAPAADFVEDEAEVAAEDRDLEAVAATADETYDDEIFEDDAFAEAAKAAVPAEEPALEPFEDEIAPAAAEGQAWPADPEAPAGAPEVSDKLRRARARVIKVRRPDAPDAVLPPEDEADLQRELAAAATEAAEAGRRGESEGRTILESAAKGDEDVTRLLRQTNTEMEGAESKRRMSTLAHLKAAVAATVAELRAPNPAAGTGEPSRLERYRADLARVVRPRRAGDAAPTERPAPLVLVSEQRIDRPSNTDAVPTRVMPRRVSNGNLALDDEEPVAQVAADADNIFASSRSFAEFAERLGASEMPDLLEAAAAYTACFEGRPHFSRPHLMRHVAAVADDTEVGREDGLRSFGQLLRQGKIEKVKRGQFAITEMSYYLAEARRMMR